VLPLFRSCAFPEQHQTADRVNVAVSRKGRNFRAGNLTRSGLAAKLADRLDDMQDSTNVTLRKQSAMRVDRQPSARAQLALGARSAAFSRGNEAGPPR
jgi:hypothetical protein